MVVYDQNGTELSLGSKLGGGGEGGVFAIDGHPGFVAKLYPPEDADGRREKIEAMVALYGKVKRVRILATVAWPLAALYADSGRGVFLGFGMARVPTKHLLAELYEYPAPPGADDSLRDKVDFLVCLCDILTALHGLGLVAGDLNDRNVLMTTDGLPALVDADSFCVRAGGRVFLCEAFNPSIVPPEISRAARRAGGFANCPEGVFTEHADDYVLALHVFRTLMNGVHPFACVPVPLANGSVPAPVDTCVRMERGETPFFKQVANVRVGPSAPDLAALPPYLTSLFRRAFVDGHARPDLRPGAAEWRGVLLRYRGELVPCPKNPLHWHWQGTSSCPYCAADACYEQAVRATAPAPMPVADPSLPPLPDSVGLLPLPSLPPLPATPPPQRAAPTAAASPATRGVTASGKTSPSGGAPEGRAAWYWALTLLIGAGVFLLLGEALPVCAALGESLGLGYPGWLQVVFLLAAVAGVAVYNSTFVERVETKSYLFAGVAATAGMSMVVLLWACLYVALALAGLAVLLTVFSD